MCGFVGRIQSEISPISLDTGLPFFSRRGPDSNHYWSTPGHEVELIQARLAIVDTIERSDQPFTCATTRATVAFNGEIYNYDQLKTELHDFPFRTESDTEVLLAVYGRWGIAGFKKLRGMFSACIVDSVKRQVVLFRDPVGKKPLFVSTNSPTVTFGSSVLSLAALQTERPKLDEVSTRQYWNDDFVAPNRSLLEGFAPVAPGEVVVYNFSGKIISRSSCEPDRVQYCFESNQDLHDCFRNLLEQSVLRRLHNNPHPVSLLSGGIDSSVVTAAASRIAPTRALTLSAGPGMVVDRKYATFAAKRANWNLDQITVSKGAMIDEVEWAISLQDEPLGMIAFFPLALLVRACKSTSQILLSGDGGDEVFCGYDAYTKWQAGSNSNETYSATELSIRSGPECPNWVSDWGRYTMGYSLLGHNFVKVDRASAEQGVEIRSPLLDWDLMDFARQLTPDQIFNGARSKGLLKSYLKDWPPWFVDRTKAGFTYRLRWIWGIKRYAGLRESISEETLATFHDELPPSLRSNPSRWRTWTIFQNFPAVWKLLAWQKFLNRFSTIDGFKSNLVS